MCFVLASSAKAWLFGSASELLIFPSVCCVQDVRGWVGDTSQVSWHALGTVAPCLLALNLPTLPLFPELIHVGVLFFLK